MNDELMTQLRKKADGRKGGRKCNVINGKRVTGNLNGYVLLIVIAKDAGRFLTRKQRRKSVTSAIHALIKCEKYTQRVQRHAARGWTERQKKMICVLKGTKVLYPCTSNCPLFGDCVVEFEKWLENRKNHQIKGNMKKLEANYMPVLHGSKDDDDEA